MRFSNISSVNNPLIKQVVRLHSAHERKKSGLSIIEGIHAIETLVTRIVLEKIFCISEQRDCASEFPGEHEVIEVTGAVMKKISTASTPSGILAVFKIPPPPDHRNLKPGIVLAQISDPGNMGTLIRTAAACGINSVVIIEGADPWSPKVIQATAGTIALIDIFEWDWKTVVELKGPLQLSGLVVQGGTNITGHDPTKSLIVVGNESRGIPHDWLKECDHLITLPMPGGTESLNAAVAGSIAMYELFVMTHRSNK